MQATLVIDLKGWHDASNGLHRSRREPCNGLFNHTLSRGHSDCHV